MMRIRIIQPCIHEELPPIKVTDFTTIYTLGYGGVEVQWVDVNAQEKEVRIYVRELPILDHVVLDNSEGYYNATLPTKE